MTGRHGPLHARLRALAPYLLVFAVAFAVLATFAGTRSLTRPSANPHFAVQAHAWSQGRLGLEGKPPGYCTSALRRAGKCKQHSYDDWVAIWTLTLNDGSTLRGIRCVTRACRQKRRDERVESWLTLDGELVEVAPSTIESRSDAWFVSFPPGPALLFLPWVLLFGLGVWDVLLTCIAGALIPALWVWWLDRERGCEYRSTHLWIAAAWTLATPAFFVAAHGRVWFSAQIFAGLFLTAYITRAWKASSPILAGLCLGMAAACRPLCGLAVLFFVLEWRSEAKSGRELLRFALPLTLLALLVGLHNYLRFDSLFEFGHRFLDIRWQTRIQEHGLFSTHYLERNLRCLMTLMPQAAPAKFPYFRVSLHGSALWLGTPWLVGLLWHRSHFRQRPALLLCAFLIALPPLFYQNSGQLQYSYRFALDWLPLILAAIAFGPAPSRRWFHLLVVAGALFQGIGAYYYERQPARIFVTDPLGWPFQAEFDEDS